MASLAGHYSPEGDRHRGTCYFQIALGSGSYGDSRDVNLWKDSCQIHLLPSPGALPGATLATTVWIALPN